METIVPKIKKTNIDYILIGICTCKRQKMLKNALLSTNLLNNENKTKIEILVVDNDPEETGKQIYENVKNDLKFNSHYQNEPNRGIAYARNRVLEEAIKLGASHILFFDDDELLTENTINEHVKMYNNTPNAQIISGPTKNKFNEKYPNYIKKHMVFKQMTTKKTGQVREKCASGNVFFPVSLVKDFELRFSTEYVFMGGEDGDFFGKASELGFTIVWCNEALIYEVVPPARANISYILNKCYYNGYAGVYAKFKKNKSIQKRKIYAVKTAVLLLVNLLLVIPSLLLGLTGFFNMLGTIYRTKGKLDSALKNESINFYEKIYGE